MNALDLIARSAAAPMSHVVVTHYACGEVERHETRSLGAANNYATGERRKIGRNLVSRNADLSAGPIVRVVSVDVEAL